MSSEMQLDILHTKKTTCAKLTFWARSFPERAQAVLITYIERVEIYIISKLN